MTIMICHLVGRRCRNATHTTLHAMTYIWIFEFRICQSVIFTMKFSLDFLKHKSKYFYKYLLCLPSFSIYFELFNSLSPRRHFVESSIYKLNTNYNYCTDSLCYAAFHHHRLSASVASHTPQTLHPHLYLKLIKIKTFCFINYLKIMKQEINRFI